MRHASELFLESGELAMLRVVLFDDIPEHREEVLGALKRALGKEGEVSLFVAGVGGAKEGTTHEERLIADLRAKPNAPVDLIVADRDLSGYSKEFVGLSEYTVRHVADRLGIPECGYARGERPDDDEYIQQAEQKEACIRISIKPGMDILAKQVVAIGQGFSTIGKRLTAFLKEKRKTTPGTLLAHILDKPDYADKISLFASGDQNRLASLAAVHRTKDAQERERWLSCLIGYWLWDSVLRFPGVVLNSVAASSYLNIHDAEFQADEKLKGLFSGALYTGPFAGAVEPLWWRGIIDDQLAESGCSDGKALAEKKLGREVRRSECVEDATKPAGYYCVLTKRPVSLENSRPGLPWFPRGADLARVSKKKYDEEGPWM